MSSSPNNSGDTFDLVCSFISGSEDGELTEEQILQFEQQLQEDPALLDNYLSYIEQTTALPRILASMDLVAPEEMVVTDQDFSPSQSLQNRQENSDDEQEIFVKITENTDTLPRVTVSPPIMSRFQATIDWNTHRIRFSTFSAALTMLAWAGFAYFVVATTTPNSFRPTRTGESFNFVAHITGAYKHRWAEDMQPMPPNASLISGERLDLVEGLIEITYFGGAVVTVEGPSVYRIDSSGAGTLEVGSLTAEVSEIARGFTVHTDRATFIDLGTKFGVDVSPTGDAQVHVFDGAVESTLHDSQGQVLQRDTLRTGEGIQFGSSSQRFVRIDAERSYFAVMPPPHVRYGFPPAISNSGLWLGDGTSQFTIVEADPYGPGGVPGNTVKVVTSGPNHWNANDLWGGSGGNVADDNLWWARRDSPIRMPSGYVALGGNVHRYEMKGATEGGEIITTIRFENPGRYDIYIVAAGRPNDTYDFLADLNSTAATPLSIGLPLNGTHRHIEGLGDSIADGEIGLWAVKVGTTAHDCTTVDLHMSMNGTTGRIIGAGYVAVSGPADSEEPDSSEPNDEDGETIEGEGREAVEDEHHVPEPSSPPGER